MSPFRAIAAYARPGVGAFALGLVGEVFGDRTHRGLPPFDLTVCSDRPGPVRTDLGLSVEVEHGLEPIANADLVFVLPGDDVDTALSPEAAAALRAAYSRGAIVAGHCVGVYLLAAAGLLAGLRAATHWRYAHDLAARYPEVIVDPEVLYVDEGRIVTGAGVAAGLDLCLYLVRREHGAAVANAIARFMVVPPHREGGQAQYIASPVRADSTDDRLSGVITWAREHLDQPASVDELAAMALMSPRSFARRFKAATGSTPHAWLLAQRLNRAEELLETGNLAVEQVARQVGFGNAATLREQFVRRRGVPPRDYRRAFSRQ